MDETINFFILLLFLCSYLLAFEIKTNYKENNPFIETYDTIKSFSEFESRTGKLTGIMPNLDNISLSLDCVIVDTLTSEKIRERFNKIINKKDKL